ncbi:beta-galactosidase [Paenibacillus sacheonensis]|uniref:Cellulase family glycosylhydrolase n=1 Tax=Paenibacillus sacheonensis TaxID=742054 RepID=A0A7X4YTY3_9BACL|nr:alpha-amylase family protein [Paenibacillus sacheonensis]MBM7566862.1 beta-galactosidase [Paenibacillus sacheonensis]NBC71484.1 cellulase family glycosylhydrolase [Paenibacillus sacheonensis]
MPSIDEDFIPFGFQYYRSPTPVRADWDKDLAQQAALGFNTVKLWIQWRASHPEPDRFEFGDVDELMDLSAKHGLKVILNVIFDTAPAWVYMRYPDSKMTTASGQVLEPTAISCRQIGGAPGPCFHHEQAGAWKDAFLAAAVNRYKDHPALYVWDLWNEPELTVSIKRELSFGNQVCYCGHSVEAFHEWLRNKYGSLAALNAKWQRTYVHWEEIEAPRQQAIVNDLVDWRMFMADTVTGELKRRIAVVKQYDAYHSVMCHTVPAPIFNLITAGSDDFQLAEPCDLFGNSLGSSAWAADLLISAAKGKKLINSEIHAMPGTTALKPRKLDWRTLKEHILIPLARGISGYVFWQYRAEVLGYEAPAWGHTYLNGDPTPWLLQTAELNRIVQANQDLILRHDARSDGVAILYSAETQIANFAAFGHLDTYFESLQGAHQLLHDLNYKAEFVHERDLAAELPRYRCLWMPFPIYLNEADSRLLRQWIAGGGTLISECSFGMIRAENGFHSYQIPGFGFDAVFGVREEWIHAAAHLDHSYHERTIDGRGDDIRVAYEEENALYDSDGTAKTRYAKGAYYQSEIRVSPDTEILASFGGAGAASLNAASLSAAGAGADPNAAANAAVTLNRYGSGSAAWIGTLMGAAYWHSRDEETRDLAERLLHRAGCAPGLAADGYGFRVDILERDMQRSELSGAGAEGNADQGGNADLGGIADEGSKAGEGGRTTEALLFVQNLLGEPAVRSISISGRTPVRCEPWFQDGEASVEGKSIRIALAANDIQVYRCTLLSATSS